MDNRAGGNGTLVPFPPTRLSMPKRPTIQPRQSAMGAPMPTCKARPLGGAGCGGRGAVLLLKGRNLLLHRAAWCKQSGHVGVCYNESRMAIAVAFRNHDMQYNPNPSSLRLTCMRSTVAPSCRASAASCTVASLISFSQAAAACASLRSRSWWNLRGGAWQAHGG